MRIIAKLTPEAQAYDDTIRVLAPPRVFELARELQRLAFPNREFSNDFEPAPLYMGQAWELHRDVNARERFAQIFALL